jgi:hypothetical protein
MDRIYAVQRLRLSGFQNGRNVFSQLHGPLQPIVSPPTTQSLKALVSHAVLCLGKRVRQQSEERQLPTRPDQKNRRLADEL